MYLILYSALVDYTPRSLCKNKNAFVRDQDQGVQVQVQVQQKDTNSWESSSSGSKVCFLKISKIAISNSKILRAKITSIKKKYWNIKIFKETK